MSHEVTKNLPVIADDGFDNDDCTASLIKGTQVKCTDGIWQIKNGDVIPPKTPMLALSTLDALQHWHGGELLEEIRRIPGQPFPDVKALNDAIPEAQWENGIDDKPRKPWTFVRVVYLLDPRDASVFTYLNSTVGCEIAVRNLRDKVKMMRALRGEKVVPLVALDNKTFKGRHGPKIRPEFTVLDWRNFATPAAPVADTTTVPAIEHMGKPVTPPSAAEILNDEIPLFEHDEDDGEFVGDEQ